MSSVSSHIIEHLSILEESANDINDFALEVSSRIIDNYKKGGITLWAGNGGSASQASHLAAELMGRYSADRAPIASLSLAGDCAVTTCIGNDFGFSSLFSRQIEGLKELRPIVVLLSTSGKSKNILDAGSYCKLNGIPVIAMVGRNGKELADLCSSSYICSSRNTAIVQELHLLAGHLICDYVETFLEV